MLHLPSSSFLPQSTLPSAILVTSHQGDSLSPPLRQPPNLCLWVASPLSPNCHTLPLRPSPTQPPICFPQLHSQPSPTLAAQGPGPQGYFSFILLFWLNSSSYLLWIWLFLGLCFLDLIDFDMCENFGLLLWEIIGFDCWNFMIWL